MPPQKFVAVKLNFVHYLPKNWTLLVLKNSLSEIKRVRHFWCPKCKKRPDFIEALSLYHFCNLIENLVLHPELSTQRCVV